MNCGKLYFGITLVLSLFSGGCSAAAALLGRADGVIVCLCVRFYVAKDIAGTLHYHHHHHREAMTPFSSLSFLLL